jgi:LPXTG-motif cell wall-anchored protein
MTECSKSREEGNDDCEERGSSLPKVLNLPCFTVSFFLAINKLWPKATKESVWGIHSRRTIRNFLERKRRISMLRTPKFSITLCVTFCSSLLFATAISTQAQKTTVKGDATVSTSQLSGEVVYVEGNDLVVKLSSGEVKTFRVPETRKFLIDGTELSVHDLRVGTTLTATVKTTTTPVTVRTRSVLSGKVWFVAPPNVILTLPDGQNKQYQVKDDVRFMIEGHPATVFDLRKGMNVSAEKIVEEPRVEVATDTTVVGHAPTAALQAAAPRPAPAPATPQPTAPETKAPAAPHRAAPETSAPAAPRPAPETEAPAAQPTAETGGTTTSPLLWFGLIALLIVVALIVMRKFRRKAVM